MRVAVVGAGLGGLLTAANLLERGYKVDVFEKLPFNGGRFTNFHYKGYEISTGALHMIPHGSKGPLAKMLRKVGAKVEIVDSKPNGTALYRGEEIKVSKKTFPLRSRLKFALYCLKNVFREVKLSELEKNLDEFSAKFLRAFLGWSLSLTPSQLSLSDVYPIYEATYTLGGPGIPVGGCKAVVDALLEVMESYDCRVKREKVRAIRMESYGLSLHFRNTSERFDAVVSDAGPVETYRLAGLNVPKLEESRGIKYSIALKEPLIDHTGVMFTLDTRRICGVNQVTNADPNLGERHFLMAHQPMITSNVKFEIAEGLKDLKEILKGYEYEILVIQSFSDGWPVNRARAGRDCSNRTPVKGLYMVGDGAKGEDIEVDGIAIGVERVVKEIEKEVEKVERR